MLFDTGKLLKEQSLISEIVHYDCVISNRICL